MTVINIHKREIQQPKIEIARLFNTLATDNDMVSSRQVVTHEIR